MLASESARNNLPRIAGGASCAGVIVSVQRTQNIGDADGTPVCSLRSIYYMLRNRGGHYACKSRFHLSELCWHSDEPVFRMYGDAASRHAADARCHQGSL